MVENPTEKSTINDIIAAISEIVRFDSSQSEPLAGAPFGEGAKKSLDYFLSLASSFGFETKNYEGYAGEVTFGEGEEFAILVHLDVVPAGNGWTHSPFGGEIDLENKRIWGRGTMDDKGPAIIVLFALKALKDGGFVPKRKIKLIAGCNEENGWACLDYYRAHAHMPDEGFSPDADFPVIYAEKGIYTVQLTFETEGDYSSLKGGERHNMVCDFCQFADDGNSLAGTPLAREGGMIISRGKSAHGSTPEKGVNAIPAMLDYLGLYGVKKALFEDRFGLCELRDETGALTFSPNVITGGKNKIEVICDVRCPASVARAEVIRRLDAGGVKYRVIHEQPPLYNDKNGELISTLCEVYNSVTGKNMSPIAIGGGTYARALKCGAGFGPEEEGEENVIHQADEYITFEKIEKCFEIYRLAIQKLTCKG